MHTFIYIMTVSKNNKRGNTMKKYLIAGLLTAALLCSLLACRQEEPGQGQGNDNPENGAQTGEQTGDAAPKTVDLGGRTVTFYTRGPDFTFYECFDIYAEEENGDRINDMVYKRNRNTENKYHFTVAEIKGASTMRDDLYKLISSGDESFDIIIAPGNIMAYLSQHGCLYDLRTIDGLSLDSPWWDQNANTDFELAGKLFFTASDLGIEDKGATWIVAFNKKILENNQLENPYQLVAQNEWTMEKYLEMAKEAKHDVNGDGKWDENDHYGIMTESYDLYGAFMGSGERIVTVNDEGYPELTVYNSRSAAVVQALIDMARDKETYTTKIPIREVAAKKAALFTPTTLRTCYETFSQIEDDFGVLPVPKFDSAQDRYYHTVSIAGSGGLVAIPTTVRDTDAVATALNALTYESSVTLIPEYFNIILNNRYMRDEESTQMLDLIFATRVFDLAQVFNWGSWTVYLRGLGDGAGNEFASYYDKNKELTETAIQETMAALERQED